MKILYIAHERSAAQTAAHALRSIAPDVTLTWARSPGVALGWIQGNRDVRAVIVDAGTQNQGCNAVLDQVRRLGTTIPVAVISPDHLDGLLNALRPGLDAVVERVRARSSLLEAQLREVQHWRQQAQQLLADRQAEHDVALSRAGRISTALQERLLELEASLRSADERHTAQAAALGLLARRETELGAVAAEAVALRAAAEQRLADSEHAHRQAEERAAADLAAAAEWQTVLKTRINEQQEARAALEARLAVAETALQDADRSHAADLAALNARLDDADSQHRTASVRSNRICTALQDRLFDLETALRRADERHAADVAATERLASRETELAAALTVAGNARSAVERDLADARAAHHDVEQRLAADVAASTARAEALEDRLNQEAAARTSLEAQIAAAATDHEYAAQQHATERVALTTRLGELQAQYDASIGRIRSLEQETAATTAALEQARGQWQVELAAAAERLAGREAELTGALTVANDARTSIENDLADARAAHHDAHQRFAADLAASVARSAALEARLNQEIGARVALEQEFGEERALTASLQDSLLQIEESTRLTMEAGSRDNERLKQEADRLRRQLDAMRAHAAALRRDVERLPLLQLRFDESQKENRRQFERAPYGLCECTPGGTITRVNHSLARLLGYRSSAELPRVDFVTAVFECADDLRWLLERAVETGKPQSVETLLKTRELGRLNVRLHASATDRSVVIAVEDLTKLNAVEQRLRQAHRLEAVGRVASEVAVTCDSLLRDVTRGGHQWLAGLESDTLLRNQGELLLGDVTRAAGFLRQFAVYGNKAINSLEPVSVPRVLREMEPVLKRVLGNDISLTLPKPAALFEVDVDAETVQRILVNVANYARERMPHGGRVKIDLAATVVDRRFLAKHPEVRPGAHVLITITEVHATTRPALPIQLPVGRAAHPPETGFQVDKPGMDLGPLVALISDLGGHLWMSAEPGGNLTLQIHIPKRTVDEEAAAAAAGSKVSRGRQFTRWFRH